MYFDALLKLKASYILVSFSSLLTDLALSAYFGVFL